MIRHCPDELYWMNHLLTPFQVGLHLAVKKEKADPPERVGFLVVIFNLGLSSHTVRILQTLDIALTCYSLPSIFFHTVKQEISLKC
jgi:hypothetical protein